MQSHKMLLYNTSVFWLFNLLQNKYEYPVVLYNDNRHQTKQSDVSINLVLSQLNIPWISRSIKDHNTERLFGKKHFLHVFSVEDFSNSKDSILSIILRNSNTFRIQNLILINEHPAQSDEINFFNKNQRLHRNTLICEQEKENIACWHWISEINRMNQTLKEVIDAPINLNLTHIRVSAKNVPPNGLTPCFSKRFVFSGLDAMVTAEILSRFNASPQFCHQFSSKFMFEYCKNKAVNSDDPVKALRQLKMNKITDSDDLFIHTMFDSRMIKYLFFEDDQCIGQPDLRMNSIHKLEDNMSALYPTEYSCTSLVIHKANPASSFIRRTFNSIESICFICIVTAFSIGRIIISNSALRQCHQCLDIFYSTIGVFLGQLSLTPKRLSESILFGFILVTSVLTTVMMSGLIYTNLVNNPSSKTIQTLDELAASDYKILVLANMKDARNWMNLRQDIYDKLIFVDHKTLFKQIIVNSSVAIAIDEHILSLFKNSDDSTNLDYNIKDIYYEMEEKLQCGHFSYRFSEDFHLENEMNRIIQQMVDHGFIVAFKKWTLHLLKVVNNFLFGPSKDLAFTMEHISGMLYLYVAGILISLLAFFCEILIKLY